jgi:hypothetical protein
MVEIMRGKTVLSGAAGIAAGVALTFLISGILITVQYSATVVKSNDWTALPECGKLGDNILQQALCADLLPGANVPEEAVYWQTSLDGEGHRLNGQHDYVLQFPPGGLPPNDGFWSVTMYFSNHTFVSNPIDRYEISNNSDFALNANGSLDIYIQNASPAGHESNWLPSPTGDFLLFLRIYLPGPSVINGSYKVPPVVEVS